MGHSEASLPAIFIGFFVLLVVSISMILTSGKTLIINATNIDSIATTVILVDNSSSSNTINTTNTTLPVTTVTPLPLTTIDPFPVCCPQREKRQCAGHFVLLLRTLTQLRPDTWTIEPLRVLQEIPATRESFARGLLFLRSSAGNAAKIGNTSDTGNRPASTPSTTSSTTSTTTTVPSTFLGFGGLRSNNSQLPVSRILPVLETCSWQLQDNRTYLISGTIEFLNPFIDGCSQVADVSDLKSLASMAPMMMMSSARTSSATKSILEDILRSLCGDLPPTLPSSATTLPSPAPSSTRRSSLSSG